MSVECIHSKNWQETIFECKRNFYYENGELMPETFKLLTGEANCYQYNWTASYSFDFESRGNRTFRRKKFRLHPSYSDDEDTGDNNISKIEINMEEKPSNGDSAVLKVFIDEKFLWKVKFDSESILKLETKISPTQCINTSSQMKIKIKICRQEVKEKVEDVAIENYNKLLESKILCDVTFVFADQSRIPAHSQILSLRSPVFASMFETDMLEKKNGKVEIIDIESNIFKLLLDFIYHGKVDSYDFDARLKLIVAADKYAVASLVGICEDYLFKNVNVTNVIDVLVTADLINAKDLKEKCIKFTYSKKREVFKTDAYKNLVGSRKNLALDMLNYIFEKM